MINEDIVSYIENEIIPMYCGFDAAHREDHVRQVISSSLKMAAEYDVNMDMVYVIAAFHDIGLAIDRKTHHLISAQKLLQDAALRKWFSVPQMEIMAQAVEDHRASNTWEPRSIYGKLVAEADRQIESVSIVKRTIQYSLSNYPKLDKEGHWKRTLEHLHEKYAEGGYLKLWIPASDNAARLNELRILIRDENRLRNLFEAIYSEAIYSEAELSDRSVEPSL